MAERYRRTTDACGEDDVRVGRETASEGEEAASFSVGVSMNDDQRGVLKSVARKNASTSLAPSRPFRSSSHATPDASSEANGDWTRIGIRGLASRALESNNRSSPPKKGGALRATSSRGARRARVGSPSPTFRGWKKNEKAARAVASSVASFRRFPPRGVKKTAFERHAEALRAPPPTARRPRRRRPRRPPAAPRARRAPPRRGASRSPAPP